MISFKTGFIYPADLHRALASSNLSEDGIENNVDETGFYIVVIRVNKNNPKSLVCKYIYYPNIFLNSFLAHTVARQEFHKSFLFGEWGDFLVIVDKRISNDENIVVLLDQSIELNQHWHDYISNGGYINNGDAQQTIDVFKKLTLSTNNLSKVIDLGVKKDLQGFFSEFSNIGGIPEESDLYFIKDCLFVCKDVDVLFSELKDLGYEIKRRSKPQSSITDSSESFLSCVDSDYRNSLYKYHVYKVGKDEIPKNCLLPKSKFSFRNIHMNLGKVRLYSTRQDLFEDNYELVADILKKKFHSGSQDVQREIELLLHNQENIFNNKSSMKKLVNYNDASFDLLETKLVEIQKLISNFSIEGINTKFTSSKYLPIVTYIIKVLGEEKIAKILLSFYMGILTKESIKVSISSDTEPVEVPGIYTIKCYHDFAKHIFNKFMYARYSDSDIRKNGGSFSDFVASTNAEYQEAYEDDNFYAIMGGHFVWKLVTVELLEEVLDKHPENRLYTVHFLRVSDKYRSKFLVNNRVYSLPQRLPMVCPPKSFIKTDSGMNLGGYLLNDEFYSLGLIKSRIGYDKDTIIKDENILINMINDYMKTPFKINKQTLDYIYKYGIEKGIIIDSSNKDIQKFISNPYGKYSDKKSKEMRSLVSKIIMEKNILSIAQIYSKLEKIYFPVKLDFRTRIYANTDCFDYQKSDLAKGLILFANPGKIRKSDTEVIQYFKAYGANMYGHSLDKKSLLYRCKWVDNNIDRLKNFEYNNIIEESENKVCFISFCFEYARFIKFIEEKDSIIFYTYLPIQLDATCNGYQHLALLTNEKNLLSKLNLSKSTFKDDPEDFYKYVKDMLSEYIQVQINKLSNIINKNEDTIKELNKFKKISLLNFDRGLLKTIIMRESYSAGIPTLVNNALSDPNIKVFGSKKDTYYIYKESKVSFNRSDITFYVMCIIEVISNIAPKIKLLSKYLNSIVRICTALQIPIPWTLPHGAIISQSYLSAKDQNIAAFSFTKSKYTFKKYMKGSYDAGKQRRSLRPNLIHSLDATTIALLYNSISSKVDLYTVHDCFAVTANNVPLLIEKLKMVYVKLYSSNNYLIEFDAMVRLTIHNTLGDSFFKVDGKYINLPDKKKVKLVEFPNVNDIINIDKSKLKKVSFPDISDVVSDNHNIDTIEESVYPII